MDNLKSSNPLHGITLEKIIIDLEKKYGWEGLGHRIKIRCFLSDPSIKSSLVFLRRTPWARKKVEDLYLEFLDVKSNKKKSTDQDLWPDMEL